VRRQSNAAATAFEVLTVMLDVSSQIKKN
jgi:hypothetical protein